MPILGKYGKRRVEDFFLFHKCTGIPICVKIASLRPNTQYASLVCDFSLIRLTRGPTNGWEISIPSYGGADKYLMM
jgi:hypothetical protein